MIFGKTSQIYTFYNYPVYWPVHRPAHRLPTGFIPAWQKGDLSKVLRFRTYLEIDISQ